MDNYACFFLRNFFKSDDNIELVREVIENLEESPTLSLFLYIAVTSKEDNPGIVQELIKAGADINEKFFFLFTPLHYAVVQRKRIVLKALLDEGIRINIHNHYGTTALHYAVNSYRHTPLAYPLYLPPINVSAPDLWILKKLLEHENINVNKNDIWGNTPLMWAIKDNQIDCVKMLLNKGARLDISDKREETPLHIALSRKDPCPYILVLLLLKQSSLLKFNRACKTPLNIIINLLSFQYACICLKVIAFKYNFKCLLKLKLIKRPDLLRYLEICWKEIDRLKCDIIAKEFTVFDFIVKCSPKSGYENPLLQIYKPVVDRLVCGIYPKYFHYVFNRIPETNLCELLEIVVATRYCNRKCDAKDCRKKHSTEFSEVFKIGLLSAYLSRLDIFSLIVTFSRMKIGKSMEYLGEECYLTDYWDEYPDKHFHLNL